MTLRNKVELRPHHILCIQHFVGNGYSEEFTQNMYRAISELEAKNPIVKLVSKSDVICSACPNRNKDICENEAKIKRLDHGTLANCHIEIGQELTWQELKESVSKNIMDKDLLQEVCHSCEWLSICKKTGCVTKRLKAELSERKPAVCEAYERDYFK